MRISDTEVQKILARTTEANSSTETSVVETIDALGVEAARRADQPMIDRLVKRTIEAPDREEMVAELRARIEAGTYNPTGDDIADAMIRRSIADRIQ